MANNTWHTHRLGNVCAKIGSGATPRGGKDVYLPSGAIALIRSQNVYNNHFATDGLAFLTEKHADELSNVTVETNDVLLNITGDSVARCTQVPPSILPARVNQHVAIIRPNPDILDPGFLRYYLVSPQMQDRMLGLAAAGATRNALTKGMIEDFLVPAPEVDSQRRIADILCKLDDKIELNRRMNETLEAMARRMFKSWFVDFDPVHAKAALRREHPKLSNADLSRRALPNMAPEIAELFPDSFEDSTLGPIPKGWEVAPIKDKTSSIQYGFTQSSSQDCVGPRFLRITDIRGGRVSWNDVPFCVATKEEAEKYRILDGDIFVARTGASTGENIYVVDPPDAVFASYLVRFQFPHRGLARYVGQYLRSPSYTDHVAGAIGGSAQPNASAQTLASDILVFPSNALSEAFYFQLRDQDLLRRENDIESNTLSSLRDKLLPKLLSGELTVGESISGEGERK